MREFKSIEEKILDRALYLIGKNRTLNISVRAIAKEAEVNVSAINYYFRTKEEMMRQVKELYIINTLSITSILTDETMEAEERLVNAINETMEYIIRYPGVSVLTKDAKEKEDTTSVQLLEISNEMTDKINSLLDTILAGTKNIDYKRIIFWSSINLSIDDNGVDHINLIFLEDYKQRIAYIRQLLTILKK